MLVCPKVFTGGRQGEGANDLLLPTLPFYACIVLLHKLMKVEKLTLQWQDADFIDLIKTSDPVDLSDHSRIDFSNLAPS